VDWSRREGANEPVSGGFLNYLNKRERSSFLGSKTAYGQWLAQAPGICGRQAMTKPSKLYQQLLANSNTIISFRDLQRLLEAFGFSLRRTKGSHRSYKHPKVPGLITIQPIGKDAAPYQVDRLLELVREFDLHMTE
jgi:predicted RNA binding protein YcfA (HicA-like mRNA interferase family)